MLQDLTSSWKAFSASFWLWQHFACKKFVEMLEEGVVRCERSVGEKSGEEGGRGKIS